jgi:peptidoglycan biosynthesis protein MviN/MurJ (putative lipid II flippase)
MKGLVNQTIYGLKISIALALPAVTITSAVAVPVVQVLFERGAFTTDASISVGIIVPIVMLRDVLFRMVLNMLGRTLYVLKDTLTTNLVNSVTLIVYVVLAIFLTRKLEYFGLTLALTLQSALIVVILCYLVIRKIKDFSVNDLGKSTFVYLMFSLLAAGVGWGMTSLLSNFSVYLQLVASVFFPILLYLALLWRFDFTVATSVFEMVGIQKVFTFLHISIPQPSKRNS